MARPKPKKQYWALGKMLDYRIVDFKPNPETWTFHAGPFDTIDEARAEIKLWVEDRREAIEFAWSLVKGIEESDFDVSWEERKEEITGKQ